MPTSQKENKQVGDKLSNIAKQVLENSVIEKDSPTEPESVLDTPTDQQEGSQTGGKLNHVLDQLREAAPEEVLPMDTDGVIVPTEDGSLLVPAVDPITANRVQLPKISTLGLPSPEQLRKLRDEGPLPAFKTLDFLNAGELQEIRERGERFITHEPGLQSAKQFQEWKDANVTGPLPGIKDPHARKRLPDSREVDTDEVTKDPVSNKSSAGIRPEPTGMPPTKILKRTEINETTNSSQPATRSRQVAPITSSQKVNAAAAADPKVTEQSKDARLQAQWRERVDALHDILLSMQPTNRLDNRTLYNITSTFFWKKSDLLSSHEWDTHPEFTCLRRINRLKFEIPSSVPISNSTRTTKCLLCLNEGKKCVQVRNVDGKVEFRTEN